MCILRLHWVFYTMNALPYGYYGLKFTPSIVHIVLSELYLYFFSVCTLFACGWLYRRASMSSLLCHLWFKKNPKILISRKWRFTCAKRCGKRLGVNAMVMNMCFKHDIYLVQESKGGHRGAQKHYYHKTEFYLLMVTGYVQFPCAVHSANTTHCAEETCS